MRVLHVITGLNIGGAELMLYKLLLRSDPEATMVVSLSSGGTIAARLKDKGYRVDELGMRNTLVDVVKTGRLIKKIKALRPDLVHTWLYHADLIGGLAARVSRVPVVWNIRQTNLDPGLNKRRTLLAARICARLSRSVPAAIVFCAHAARRSHERYGYKNRRHVVIPNGVDIEKFTPSSQARSRIRRELGIGDHEILIGLVGRDDPQKGHAHFVAAAQAVHSAHDNAVFLLAGKNMDKAQGALRELINAGSAKIITLGERDDVPDIMNALDIYLSTSLGEGWPNVVAEAMASGVPCVVSDAGDSRAIVDGTGWVYPVGDIRSAVQSCIELIERGAEYRKERGRTARERIVDEFDIEKTVQAYHRMHREMVVN